jgi:ATP-dependent helicase/nuclease subunit A
VQFTAEADAEATLTDFADYVNCFTTRDVADTSTVKIVTVHRSKGLGFDYLILPIIETRGIDNPRTEDRLTAPDDTWLLTRPPKQVVSADPVLAAAATANLNDSVFEALCVQYVAMTRAKHAMTVLLKPSPKTSSDTLFFSNHIEAALGNALPWQQGDENWFNAISTTPKKRATAEQPAAAPAPTPTTVRRTIASAHERMASELFAAQDTEATRRGTRMHESLQKIEWLDDADTTLDIPATSTFRDALRKPSGVVELWRERSFEVLDNGEWVSGIFDRVAIIEENGKRRAELYDYKTNRKRDNESAGQCTERMRQTYAQQMNAYCRALTLLTNIPATNIRTTLLLTETMTAVNNG